jgi:hypothetical protein
MVRVGVDLVGVINLDFPTIIPSPSFRVRECLASYNGDVSTPLTPPMERDVEALLDLRCVVTSDLVIYLE